MTVHEGSESVQPSEVSCAFCGKKELTEVIDFGDMALAGGFLKEQDFVSEQKYPLKICFCAHCFAVQVEKDIDPDVLFGHYFYFSSAIRTLREHFTEYAIETTKRFLSSPKTASVLEIGCNDGILLSPFANQGVGTVIGVDPARRVTDTIADSRVHVINDYFTTAVADDVKERFGAINLVVANNAYAHIRDINGVTTAIQQVLADDGVFMFEVHYLGKILDEFQYDMMYHEHLYYYSLLALDAHLARFGMLIFDVKPIPIHGGSIRYYACKKDSYHSKEVTPAVSAMREHELARGYDKAETYRAFAKDCTQRRKELMTILESLRAQGKTIAGYGASGRANTIIQYCGIDKEHLDYIIDDAPAKKGFYTPGSHFLIKGNDVLDSNPPDYVLVFAWAFLNEIAVKCKSFISAGGLFIVPLPEVKIFPENSK